MSSWGQGGTRNTRRTRQQVLDRDRGECQLRMPGCTWTATEAHHRHSIADRRIRRADATDPDDCIAVCAACHRHVTDRQRDAAVQRMAAHRRARRRLPTQPHPGDNR